MTTAAEYRAMAAEHHRYAGMCRSPESRERHFSLEQQFLALAKVEESDANSAATRGSHFGFIEAIKPTKNGHAAE